MSELETLQTELQAAQDAKDWPKVLALLARFVELEAEPFRSGAYCYSMALIRRDELADPVAAVEHCNDALDNYFLENPTEELLPMAMAPFGAIERMLREDRTLERQYRKMIYRVKSFPMLQADLYEKLAAIYTGLDSPDAAASAMAEATRLRSQA
ncbi:MAG: hypothetical protein NT062_36280 [Proteobacteria bacterium]|nr:hypothetical protein [Pseudomonadota bacterium]